MQNVSHENDFVFVKINEQVTYIKVCTKTLLTTDAKVNLELAYSSMTWNREPLIQIYGIITFTFYRLPLGQKYMSSHSLANFQVISITTVLN